MKNYLSFAAYGPDPRYYNGVLANIRAARELLPEWQVVAWVDGRFWDWAVPMEKAGAITRPIYNSGGIRGMFDRFKTIDLPDCGRMAVRDADSLVTPRDAAALREWIASGKDFHLVRDHAAHHDPRWPIQGGMWGATKSALPGMAPLIQWWHSFDGYGADQDFLKAAIWPRLTAENTLTHSSLFGCYGPKNWDAAPEGEPHVGQRLFERGKA